MMVAYSFKERFVEPIRWGLGLGLDIPDVVHHPKRQTIRSHRRGRSRHAQPGDELQLYTAMRTKYCRLIGKARCVSVEPITIWVRVPFEIWFDGDRLVADRMGSRRLREFALSDGFESINDMAIFWLKEHGQGKFEGVIIRWEPLA